MSSEQNILRALPGVVAAVVLAAGVTLPARAQNVPARVTQGRADWERRGEDTLVRLHEGSRLEWQGFTVSEKGSLRFESQKGGPFPSLNVVRGADAAIINGRVIADGPFYLISPAGIIINGTGSVQAPSVLLSALEPDNDLELLRGGRTTFRTRPGAADRSVSIGGRVAATSGSLTVLGPRVLIKGSNPDQGELEARNGVVRVIAAKEQAVTGPDANGGYTMARGNVVDERFTNTGRITAARVDILSDGYLRNGGRIEALGTVGAANGVVRLAAPKITHELKPTSVILTHRLETDGPFVQEGPVIFKNDGANPSALGGVRQTPRLSRPGFLTNAEAGMTQLSHSPLQNGATSTSPLPRTRASATVASRRGSEDTTAAPATETRRKKQPSAAAPKTAVRKASFFGQTFRR